jgi:predicted double-glycine peptidase
VVLSDPSFGTVTMKVARFASLWKGGIGFIVLRPGAAQTAKGLEPKAEEFLIPDGGGIGRASTMSPTPLTGR